MNKPASRQGLFNEVLQTVNEYRLLETGDSVLIAVSGGADSMVLLDLMIRLRTDYNLKLGIAHLNHGLRGEASDQDCAFVQQMAHRLGLPCHTELRDVNAFRKQHKRSLEEAARMVRYEFLFGTADRYGYKRIATAHHAGDNAELVVMNLMRGSGPTGLSGLAALSFSGRLIRPLHDISRADIMDYLARQGLSFREDASNQDRSILRNRIRLELLPDIEARYQEGFTRILTRTARIIEDDEAWLDDLVEPLFQGLIIRQDDTRLDLNRPELARFHVAARRRIIRKAIGRIKGDLRGIGLPHVESVVRLLDPSDLRKSLDLPGRIRVLGDGGTLIVKKEDRPLRQTPPFRNEPAMDFSYRVDPPDKQCLVLPVPEAGLRFRFTVLTGPDHHPGRMAPDTALIGMDRLTFPLTIRNVRVTDRFAPLGMTGHQTVYRFLSNRKVRPEKRKDHPVLVSGQDIVWVCGHRIDEKFRLNPGTEKVLKIELLLA